jgi:DNA-directed RNA polymerase subunit RPC12/RpoP
MKYLKSKCQKCGGQIEFPEQGLFEMVACPHCAEQIQLLQPSKPGAPMKLIITACIALSAIYWLLSISSEFERFGINLASLPEVNIYACIGILGLAGAPLIGVWIFCLILSFLYPQKKRRKAFYVSVFTLLALAIIMSLIRFL